MNRPLLLGAGGQTGFELARRGNFEIVPRSEADLADPGACRAAVLAHRPPVVVTAAYTAVDKAESELETAFAVNGDGPAALAEACAELGTPLVHLSTDYVFDGSKSEPYVEDDSMLDYRRLQAAYGISSPDWRVTLPVIIRSLEGSAS